MRDSFALVGMMPTYREGALARSALDSLLPAVDEAWVWEGPTGSNRCEAPDTDIGLYDAAVVHWREGRWESDAAKRTAMLRAILKAHPGRMVWAVIVDADEVLVNGAYVRDLIRAKVWEDEHKGATIANPDNLPTGGIPLRLIEYDGTCALAQARLLRLDTLRRFVVANLIVETVLGSHMRIGHVAENMERECTMRAWVEREAVEKGWQHPRRLIAPPLPGEPCVLHRSHLRHPLRAALRQHAEEARELERLGLPN